MTDVLFREHIIFHEFHTFNNLKYIGDAAARAYVATSKMYHKPMLLKPINFNQSFTIQDLVNEVKQHRKVELHENIVRFYGITKEDRGQYQYMLLLEYSDEGTLCSFLKKSFKQLKWDVKLKLAKQLVNAVYCLHGNDIVHKDLNSVNILIQNGNIKLSGFGITTKTRKPMNALSKIYGTVFQYVDPEYLKNHQEFIRNKKSDVYSVGVVLWQITSGRIPFEFELPDFSLVQSIIEGKREIAIKGIPSKYVEIYTACWEGNPKNRPNIQQVLKKLNEIEIIGEKSRGTESTVIKNTTPNTNDSIKDVEYMKNSFSSTASTPSSIIFDILAMFKTRHQSDESSIMTYISSQNRMQFDNCNDSAVGSCSTLVEKHFEKKSLEELLSKPGTISEIKYSLENLNKDINELILRKLLLEFINQFYLSHNTNVTSDWLNEFIQNHIGVNDQLSSKYLLDMMLNHKHQAYFTNLLGFFYEHGIGCDEMDQKKAFDFYLRGSVYDECQENICSETNLCSTFNDTFLCLNDILLSIGQYFLGLFYYKGINDDVDQDFEKAFEWISKSSENGNIVAQCMLGYLYEHGFGTPKSEKQAFEWYMKSAEGGNACGQCNVGLFYDKGSFLVTQNKYEAFKWYSKAAEGGDSTGQYNLGLCYEEGIGTVKDKNKAFEWYMKSAERGNASGQCKIGVCYEEGISIEKNWNKAFNWYLKSAKNYDILGQYNLGLCYMKGIGTNKNEAKAFDLFLEFAEAGNSLIQCYLEYCYDHQIGMVKNSNDEAVRWDSKPTEEKDILKHCNLALCFENIVKDNEQAFEWCLKFAKSGNSTAQYYLGECFENGLGTKKDVEKAFEWYLKSAEGDNRNSQYKVGHYYQNGIGVAEDKEKAFEWLLKSAENGITKAQFAVALCYMYGIGTKKHVFESITWFQKANEKDDNKFKASN
ncbi:3605_t:CDS:2 [Funneliformis geosporum]|nr:3605_t:CDS:2 [Funneliformis geosporum]